MSIAVAISRSTVRCLSASHTYITGASFLETNSLKFLWTLLCSCKRIDGCTPSGSRFEEHSISVGGQLRRASSPRLPQTSVARSTGVCSFPVHVPERSVQVCFPDPSAFTVYQAVCFPVCSALRYILLSDTALTLAYFLSLQCTPVYKAMAHSTLFGSMEPVWILSPKPNCTLFFEQRCTGTKMYPSPPIHGPTPS